MNIDEHYPDSRSQTPPPSHWPQGVRRISQEGLNLIGVGNDGHLHWDGIPVHTAHRLNLSKFQAGFALCAALAAVLVAVLDLLRFIGLGS